jgi:hypothetical protein
MARPIGLHAHDHRSPAAPAAKLHAFGHHARQQVPTRTPKLVVAVAAGRLAGAGLYRETRLAKIDIDCHFQYQ